MSGYMKRMIMALASLLCMAAWPCGAMADGDVPSRELGFARNYARDFLVEYGADPNRIQLKMEEHTDRLLFFNDMRNHLFLLMVRDGYAGLVNGQVLAFSIGTPHSKARETPTFMTLLSYYDALIRDMHDGTLPREQDGVMDNIWIKPMLHRIRWRQFGLRGLYENQHASVLSGCGPVAVAQLMRYHEWPDTVRGDYSYLDRNKERRAIRMDGTPIDWGRLKDIYRYHDKDSDSLAPLMRMVSMALTVQYGVDGTYCQSKYIKRALTTHFGYSPEMFLAVSGDVEERRMMRLIQDNLRAGQPCILTGGNHVFVCDGAFKDFLHLNMGWSGSYDGWYRFPIVSDRVNDKAFIETALLNIRPLDGEPAVEKTLQVERPGTLPELLTDTEKATIGRLTISGSINGRDIRLLRRMAGSVAPDDIGSWRGRLTDLDISRALIVTDTVSYLDDKVKRGDSIYIVPLTTRAGIIGPHTFDGCENLRRISLPQTTRRIGNMAFANCHALEEIAIPTIVRSVDGYVFWDCRSLRQATVCRDSPLLKSATFNRDRVFLWCSPDLRIMPDDRAETYAEGLEREQERIVQETERQRKKVDPELYKRTEPMKYRARYKMVNGKKVLIERVPIN